MNAFSRIEEEASEWLVILSDPSASSQQRDRFAAWLSADAEHERVFQAQRAAWSMIGGMGHLIDEVPTSPAPSATRRAWPLAAAAAVVVAVIGALLFRVGVPLLTGERFSTEVAQLKEVTLDDGTTISLGAASRISVDFNDRERRVKLLDGQAFFDVAHDPSRPFFVSAGATTVRVVGTRFDVTRAADSIRVSVLEGRVEVLNGGAQATTATAKADAQPTLRGAHALTAGQGASVSNSGQLNATFPVAQENLAAWRSGRLVYVDARLRDVVADVTRYYGGEIQLADPSVGDLQLTAAFRADQIDRMLEVLARALPIEVIRVDERTIRLAPRAE
ncbi:FecR family protein [Peristeroidobacter soli]|uniref:FecR family protein n=1 Tax=Peristeroidobacter soli TaxID=2497877 RepID=UPI00101B9D04|nr:FecR family protein [Peristeroidobacter soli]